MPFRRGIPRPASIAKPTLALLAVSTALFGIAKTTGSGWLIVMLAILGAVVVLAVALPVLGVLGVRVEVSGPRDATVGHPLALQLGVRGARMPVLVSLDGMLRVEATAVDAPAEGRVEGVAVRRGIVDDVCVDVRCGAPLGLFWWRRSVTCRLERSIEIGPWPADVAVPPPSGAGAQGAEAQSAPHRGDDLIRGAREYVPGDPIKAVHWTATARQGDLMVKELEAAAAPPLTVSVDLGPGAEADAIAALAAGVAVAALEAGIPVSLLTCEREGPVAGAVATRVDVGRRLARAVPGRAAEPSAGAGRVVRVDAKGVRW